MFLIIEKTTWLFGILVNLLLISKLLIRPVLWSTTNTFLVCFLSINVFFLLVQILLVVEENDEKDPYDEVLIHVLDSLFYDHQKSIFCSVQYMSNFIHATSTLNVLLGTIFIRSMMVKHADNMRPNSLDCKSHQARLSIIGILVAVFIFTFCSGVIIVLIFDPLSPFDFVLVRNCREVPISYSEEEMRKIMQGWLSRLVSLAIFALATFSCHVRIIQFKRRHNMSYFSHFRQNIATVDQSLAAAYLKIGLAVFKEVIFYSIINKSTSTIEVDAFMKISNVLNCIAIPCYWIYSTKQDFNELWSKETVFWRKFLPANKVVSPRLNGVYSLEQTSATIEPRGPHIQETSFMGEESHPYREERLDGRFSYGFQLKTKN